MSAEEYQARLATALQWPGRQQVYAYEDVATGMMSFPAPTPVLQFGNMDTTGRIRPNATNAAGEQLGVSDADASTTADAQILIRTKVGQDIHMFGDLAASGTPDVARRLVPRIMFVTLTSEVNGAILAAPIVPALAGYQACCRLTHMYSDQTDAAGILNFTATSGLDAGIAALTVATVANAVAPEFGPGLYWQTTGDNETLDVDAGIGEFGNTQAVTFIGFYWYET